MSEQREVKNIFTANLIDGNIVLHVTSQDKALVALAIKLLDMEFENWILSLQMRHNANKKKIIVPEPVVSSKLMQELRGE